MANELLGMAGAIPRHPLNETLIYFQIMLLAAAIFEWQKIYTTSETQLHAGTCTFSMLTINELTLQSYLTKTLK